MRTRIAIKLRIVNASDDQGGRIAHDVPIERTVDLQNLSDEFVLEMAHHWEALCRLAHSLKWAPEMEFKDLRDRIVTVLEAANGPHHPPNGHTVSTVLEAIDYLRS